MSIKEKFFAFVLTVSLVLVFYLALSTRSININNNPTVSSDADKIGDRQIGGAGMILADNYRIQSQELVDEYESFMSGNVRDPDELRNMENRLLGLVVPGEYKDLHIDLLFALIKMEDYISSSRTESLDSSQNMINGIKDEYKWLN